MTLDIEQIKREVHEELGYPEHPISRVIDYLHQRGYLGGVIDEPTTRMNEAGKRKLDELFNHGKDNTDHVHAALVYKAMIAAAPKGETK